MGAVDDPVCEIGGAVGGRELLAVSEVGSDGEGEEEGGEGAFVEVDIFSVLARVFDDRVHWREGVSAVVQWRRGEAGADSESCGCQVPGEP